MKKLFLIIVLVSLSLKSIAQEKSVGSTQTNNVDLLKQMKLKLATGVFLPQGNLKNYFGTAPFFELSLDFPIFKTKTIGFAVQFAIPNQKEDFVYERTIDTINAKSTFMANFVVNFKKTIIKTHTKDFYLNLGVGASSIQTNARNPFYSGNKEENKYENITSILFNPSLNYSKRFNKNTEFTFSISAQYSPYKVEGAVQEDIGSFAIIPKIAYTF